MKDVLLRLEKNIPREGYDRAKELITTLDKDVIEYRRAIADLKKSKNFYDKMSKELLELKGKYNREMERFIGSLPSDDRK